MAKWVDTIWGLAPALKGRRKRVGQASSGSPTGSASRAKGRTRKRSRREHGQLSLAEVPTWGGRRAGAGRPRGKRPPVPHRTREAHRRHHPVHVTLRRARGLPSFRTELVHRLLLGAIRDTCRVRSDGFRVVQYSIQADHMHVIVEAEGHDELSNGMRSLAIRIALRLNRLLDRERGRVWGDRHHRRDLTTPSEVRNALVYLLANHLKHGETDVGLVDPCSSGPWFAGWIHGLEPPPPTPCVASRATTWLLRKGWETQGFIHRGEVPREVRRGA